MRRSTDRILTTHVGSLPRPTDLREMWSKPTSGPAEEALAKTTVEDPVRAQRAPGFDNTRGRITDRTYLRNGWCTRCALAGASS